MMAAMNDDQFYRLMGVVIFTPIVLLIIKKAHAGWNKVWAGLPYKFGSFLGRLWARRNRTN